MELNLSRSGWARSGTSVKVAVQARRRSGYRGRSVTLTTNSAMLAVWVGGRVPRTRTCAQATGNPGR